VAKKKKLTPYQKIARAAERGTGCRLTAEDVQQLWMDDAIQTVAERDDYQDETGEDSYW
jgi:hypothetical protein